MEAATEVEKVQPEVKEDAEKVDPSTPLWPGGASQSQIDAWKQSHGEVWITEISVDERYVWRTLARIEWKKLQKSLESMQQGGQNTEATLAYEELICEACVLFPQVNKADLQIRKAGIASLIAQQILDASGFQSLSVERL